MPFDFGTSSIENIVFGVLGYALGAGADGGAINKAVTPAVVGQAGATPWLSVTEHKDKLTAGWKPGKSDNKLTFWRKHPGTHVEWINIEIAGTSDGGTTIRKKDTGTFTGSLAAIRDAWVNMARDVPGLTGSGTGSKLDPASIQQTRNLFKAAAGYFGEKQTELEAMLAQLNRDESTFRGSASEAYENRVRTAMVKVAGAKAKADAWDEMFGKSYEGARLFALYLQNEMNSFATAYDGTLVNPHNFVIKLLNSATIEVRDGQVFNNSGKLRDDLNKNHDITTQGTVDSHDGLVTNQTARWKSIGITIPALTSPGPYDVFIPASWQAIDVQIRALWAKKVAAAFPDTIKQATALVKDFDNGAAALIPPRIGKDPKTSPPPNLTGNGNLNYTGPNWDDIFGNRNYNPNGGGGGGDINLNMPPMDFNFPEIDLGGGDGLGGPNSIDDLYGNSNPNLDLDDQEAFTSVGGPNLDPEGNPNLDPVGNTPLLGLDEPNLDLDPEVGGEGLGNPNLDGLSQEALTGDGGPEVGGGLGLDTNGDGIPDTATPGFGSDLGLDTNGDGIPDTQNGFGSDLGLDPNGDGVPDTQTGFGSDLGLDTDGDGIPDSAEGGFESGVGAGVPTTLGQLGREQLRALRDGGQLDDVPLTDEMRDALDEAGLSAGSANDLGDLSDEQLGALSDAGLLDDIALTPEEQQMLSDAGLLTPDDLGDLNTAQLGALSEAGALDDVPLTGAMVDALADAGLPAGDASSLGDLSEEQLGALSDAGLLDDLSLTPEDQQILQDEGLLGSSDGLDLGSLGGGSPQDLGDLSTGQLGQLESSGLLDDIPVTQEQLGALQDAGLLGSDTSGIDSLGDLTPGQLEGLQDAGLLDEVGLTPGQMTELGLDPGSGLGTGLDTGLGTDLGTDLGLGTEPGQLPGSDSGLTSSISSGLTPDSFGSNVPSSQFPTAVNGLDVGAGTGGGLGGPSGTPLDNVSKALSTNLGSGLGLESGGLKPSGDLAGLDNIGTLGTPAAAAQTSGGSGQSMMPPMMPPMGGGMGAPGGAGDKNRDRKTWLTEDEDVWGTDPDSAPAVIGRSDDDTETVEEPTVPGFPSSPRPDTRPDRLRRPGRG